MNLPERYISRLDQLTFIGVIMNSEEDVLHLLIPSSSHISDANWAYYHPAARDVGDRKIVVDISNNWDGFYLDVSYVDRSFTFVLESVSQIGLEGRAEVLKAIKLHVNRLAAKWMYPHDQVPRFSLYPDGMSVLIKEGFMPHDAGGNTPLWRADHGEARCVITSTANGMHVWKDEPVIVTVYANSSLHAWQNAKAKEMSLADALSKWAQVKDNTTEPLASPRP